MFAHDFTPPGRERYQQIGTRFYIVLLCISLQIVWPYTIFQTSLHYHFLTNLTEDEYNLAEQMSPKTISCQCSSITINYSTFLSIKPQFHQVCSSAIVSYDWIYFHTTFLSYARFFPLSYRYQSLAQFSTLSMLCYRSNITVNAGLDIFLKSQFVSSQLIARALFESQINTIVDEWKTTMANDFSRTIELIRSMTHRNQLMDVLGYNSTFIEKGEDEIVQMNPLSFEN